MFSLEDISIECQHTVRDALAKIDKNLRGVCFVTKNRKLVGVITDGDARRVLLNGEA